MSRAGPVKVPGSWYIFPRDERYEVNTMEKILVVDDEESIVDVLSIMLEQEGYQPLTASGGDEALRLLEQERVDLVISDMKMSPMHGLEFLQKARDVDPEITAIMMTAYASIENAVEAMRQGAFEYVIKPFKIDELRMLVRRALDQRNIINENRELKKQIEHRYNFDNIVGESEEMQKVYHLIDKVAPADSTVLIYGESGTGKELVARAIHYHSHRKNKRFEPLNCGALPETLLESELFGYVKGAFTGADGNKDGLFSAATGGTVFLDEIGTMSIAMQMKLLRVLQEKEIKRLGDTTTRKIDVRVISATNERLDEKVERGEFREDLYYRLSVIPVEIPPLRTRRDDIPLLVEHFMAARNKKYDTDKKVSPEALRVFMNHDWPGNVRELENMIERTVTLMDNDVIMPDDFPSVMFRNSSSLTLDDNRLKTVVCDSERSHIRMILQQTGGDKKQASEMLGISVPSLYRKICQLNIADQ
jgi:two-component system, NtrC family, response regulator PilR